MPETYSLYSSRFSAFSHAFKHMHILTVPSLIDLLFGTRRSVPLEKNLSIGTPVPETAKKSLAMLDKFGYR